MSTPGRLNVIFHGQWAFVCTDECIEAMAPEVAGHLYHAGRPDLVQIPALPVLSPRASYLLTGVTRESKTTRFDATQVPVLSKIKVIDRSATALHCSVYFPIPKTITSLRATKGYFQGEHAQKIKATTLALTHVFTYDFPDLADVRLDGLGWAAVFQPNMPVANLHLFADPDPASAEIQDGHPKKAFRHVTRLFPAVDLQLNDYAWTGPVDAKIRGIEFGTQHNAFERQQPANQKRSACVSLVIDNT